ncbi:MAG TPA: hypothetical protein EYQ00_10975 [Dehalococcoidia bacterium]|jgi:hypothetical protein|nr:hypothetical protein [Dehalococcoidia bacterium]
MLKKFIMICVTLMCTTGITPAYADNHAVGSPPGDEWTIRKGMRFGYNYAHKADESKRLESPHMFAMGFEIQETMAGGDWLDLLFIQNITVSGLEQSVIVPSGNVLVGFEINDTLQLGVGANVTLYDPSGEEHYVHLVSAIGWTQAAGGFSVPLHVVFIPDVNNYYRFAVTTGVNW